MKGARRIAFCGMSAALCVVLLVLGGWSGVGIYAAPMLAGMCLWPVGREYGVKYHLTMWAAAGLLSMFLIPDLEESLMFLGFFGWYPALRPALARLPKGVRLAVKFAVFNAAVVGLEALLLLVLAPAQESAGLLAVLWMLGNLVFAAYDHRLIPRVELLYERRLRKVLFPGGR